jgi:hypothetical protein
MNLRKFSKTISIAIFKKSMSSLSSCSQKPFIIPQSLGEENILTKALVLAKYVHYCYDRNKELNCKEKIKFHSENSYHEIFTNGLGFPTRFGNAATTKNCLIIESTDGIPITRIHSPHGIWSIVGENQACSYRNNNGNFVDSDFLLREEIFKHIECVKIFPEIESDNYRIHPALKMNNNRQGPFWMVKAIHGVPVEHLKCDLLPENPDIDSKEWNGKSREERFENMRKKYLDQLYSFYNFLEIKNREYFDDGKFLDNLSLIGYKIEEKKQLEQWIEKGYISDVNGFAKLMIRSNHDFEYLKKYFIDKINPKSHDIIIPISNAHTLFRMIYYAKMNDNTFTK